VCYKFLQSVNDPKKMKEIRLIGEVRYARASITKN
jgi:hypothetical protein